MKINLAPLSALLRGALALILLSLATPFVYASGFVMGGARGALRALHTPLL